jgi:ubiquinone/menaquinone biosynthesis C-methylase UbiE
MVARDPHRFVNQLDDATRDRLIARLENRAQDMVFAKLFDNYATRIGLAQSERILDVGCGTGAMLRQLVRRHAFTGRAIGIDHCQAFVDTATVLAGAECLDGQLTFQVGDAHSLEFPEAEFEVVIAHTVLSHVTEPGRVVGEMARVLRAGGTLVVFDGDYASLTYAFPDHSFGHKMDAALAGATYNNPRIMRDLPRLLADYGLKLVAAWGDAVVEIGSASYFKSFAETYVPHVKTSGLLPVKAVDVWLAEQRQAMQNGTFFAACNYYTYQIERI